MPQVIIVKQDGDDLSYSTTRRPLCYYDGYSLRVGTYYLDNQTNDTLVLYPASCSSSGVTSFWNSVDKENQKHIAGGKFVYLPDWPNFVIDIPTDHSRYAHSHPGWCIGKKGDANSDPDSLFVRDQMSDTAREIVMDVSIKILEKTGAE